MIAGSCATERYQSRQVRKEAAAVTPSVCRRVAWLSPQKFPAQTYPLTFNRQLEEWGYQLEVKS